MVGFFAFRWRFGMLNAVYICGAVLILVAIYDVVQTKHAILRNFPILGHLVNEERNTEGKLLQTEQHTKNKQTI